MIYRFQPRTEYPEEEAEQLSAQLLENYQYIHCSNLNRCNYAQFLNSVIKHPSQPSEGSIRRHAMRNEGVTFRKKAGAFFDRVFGDGKKQAELDKSRAAAEIKAQQRYADALSVYNDEMAEYHERLDYYENLLHQGDPDVTRDYYNYVLRGDKFSADTFSDFEIIADAFSYDKQTGTLEVSYRIPETDEIPAISRFVYDHSTGELVGQELSKRAAATHRLNFSRALLLRAAATIHISDEASKVRKIVMNGYIYFGGTASGRSQKKLVIKATFPCELIEKLSPEHIEIARLFTEDIKATEVPGLYTKDPYELGEMPYVAPSPKATVKRPVSQKFRLAKQTQMKGTADDENE